MRIIAARYGSLTHFTVTIASVYEISRRLRIPAPTISYFLRAFTRRRFDIDAIGRKYTRFKMLTPEIKKLLQSETLL